MKTERPGLYLVVGTHLDIRGCLSLGDYQVRHVPGALVSVSETGDIWLGIDGILTGAERHHNETDADLALLAYQRGGIEALRELSGYFTLLLVAKDTGQAWLISDLMATRPYYIYASAGKVSISPDISFSQSLRLPVTLDRQVLYQMFRINHPLGGRCLAREIERTQPFTHYKITSDGRIERISPSCIEQIPNPQLTLDAAADSMHEVASSAVASILSHPAVRSLSLELPLTGGYDSRHLLGELLALGRPPDRVRHIIVDETDYSPVKVMCRELELNLDATRFGDLDQAALIRHWLHRTAGQVHLHQLYLFGLGSEIGSHPFLGLTAYLSGLLFSYAPLGTPINRRHYTRISLSLLFPDYIRMAREFKEQFEMELNRFAGEKSFRLLAVDAVNRSPRYAGAAFVELGDNAIYFAPAANNATWEWFRRVPSSVAWRQKARIRLFERHFPQLSLFPTLDGSPLIRSQEERKYPSISRAVPKLLKKSPPFNPVPPTPHAWLRVHQTLRCLTERVVMESKLEQDGEIPRAAIRLLWAAQQHGAPVGWPLMSLVTTEAAYRILILGEDPNVTADWLMT